MPFTPDDTIAWYAALAFGTLIVGNYAWSRFDEPSYEDKSQFFRLYAPRFSTPSRRYWNARLGYVVAIIGIFFFFSLFPRFLFILTGGQASDGGAANLVGSEVPLIVAALLIGLSNAPGLKHLEVKVRSALHALGRIPDGVRRTVGQLKSAQLDFDNYEESLGHEVSRLAQVLGDGRLTLDLALTDSILRRWLKICCLLDRLADKGSETRIGESFFDTYEEELESIMMRRDAMIPRIDAYAANVMRRIPTDADQPFDASLSPPGNGLGDGDLVKDLRLLRNRLYTFIACGLRSSLKSELNVSQELIGLGFDVRPMPTIGGRQLLHLAGLFLLIVISLTVFTVLVTRLFNQEFVEPNAWPPGLERVIPVPQDFLMQWLWTLFAACFYLAAVVGALFLRAIYIAKLKWFELDLEQRQRAYTRYIAPIIVGGVCGYAVLCLLQLLGGHLSPQPEGTSPAPSLIAAMKQSLYWIPIAVIVSFSALWVSDAELTSDRRGMKLLRGLAAGLVAAVFGGLISYLSSSQAQREMGMPVAPPEFETALVVANLMVAGFVALLASLLMVLIQFSEHRVQAHEALINKWLTLRSNDGSTLDICLASNGTAMRAGEEQEECLRAGTWIHYPEGHVVRWEQPQQLGAHSLQGHGLLLRAGDTIMFEDCMTDAEQESDFVAQVSLKANGAAPQPETSEPPGS